MNKKITLFLISFLIITSISFAQALDGGEIQYDGGDFLPLFETPDNFSSKVAVSGGDGTYTYKYILKTPYGNVDMGTGGLIVGIGTIASMGTVNQSDGSFSFHTDFTFDGLGLGNGDQGAVARTVEDGTGATADTPDITITLRGLTGGEIDNGGQTEITLDVTPNPITSVADATEGDDPYTYAWFYSKNDGDWKDLSAFGTATDSNGFEFAANATLSMANVIVGDVIKIIRHVVDDEEIYNDSNIITITAVESTAAIDIVDGIVVNLYPNPATNRAYFPVDLFESVEIFNSVGQKVVKSKGGEGFIDTSSLETGLYYVKMLKENVSVTKKLLIE